MNNSTNHPQVRLMIVDDHPNTAAMLARVLSKFEFPVDVRTASSGEDALKQIKKNPVDILITDFMMPGINGLELIERLKGPQKPAHTILITAYDTPGLLITARRLNVKDYLVKPVQPDRIRSLVAKVINDMHPKMPPAAPDAIPAKRPYHILVADDYPDNLRLLSSRLQSEGYVFSSAWDGEETLRKIREEEPDLVLLDVNMPKKDGFQVLSEMRADPAISYIPVIMITAARIGPHDVRDGLMLGADDYVVKPFDWRELAARIQSKLRVKHAEDVMRRRTKELEILPEIGQELIARWNMDELIDIVLTRTSDVLQADARLDIFLPDGHVSSRIRRRKDSAPMMVDAPLDSSHSWGAIETVMQSRQGVIISDAKNDSRWKRDDQDVLSAAAAPLVGRRRVIGVITLMHDQANYFNTEHPALLQVIASQAAMALENAQPFDMEYHRVQDLIALTHISKEINRYSYSQPLLDGLPQLVQEYLGYPIVALWDCPSGQIDDLMLRSIVGDTQLRDRSWLFNVPAQVMESGQPILESQPVQSPSAAAAPLILDGKPKGVLAIYNERANAFHDTETALLQTLATQVAAALERVSSFESVEHEQRKLLAVLHNVADAILVMDSKTCLTLANPAGERLFQDAEALVGQPLPKDLGYDDLARLLEQVSYSDKDAQGEVAWPDGRTFTALVTPIPEGGHVVLLHDITQFKALAQLKDEYIATASHDLKNPIMAVLGYNALMAKAGPMTDMQVDFSNRIHDAAIQMRDLVLNLLEISRLEAGMPMKLERVYINELVRDALASVQDQAKAKGHNIFFNEYPSIIEVNGDRTLLQQMVSNILSNAVKYTPSSGQIIVSTEVDDGQVEIRIKDNGIGISETDLEFIFNKFYRVANDDTRDIDGTGLGLAIVQSIIENHQGNIKVESQVGRGTTFIVRLPLVNNMTVQEA